MKNGMEKNMKNKRLKLSFIVVSVMLAMPSMVYLVRNKGAYEFNIYYNFFLKDTSKILSTLVYLVLLVILIKLFYKICKENIFSSINEIIKFVACVGIVYILILPWTSSDIFYYMGVGELDGVYKQNPYYVSMREYYDENNIDDQILEKGANNCWGSTTVVYGPIAQIFFKICSMVSMKNVTIALMVFKIVNYLIHLVNTYLIYKISNKKKFALLYAINPFILLEAISNVHNDVIIVLFILLSLYYLIKKKNLMLSIMFLAFATGIKYFPILLLPIIILYHYRKEKKVYIRLLRCIQYGIIFLAIMLLEYMPYYKDYKIFLAMIVQTERFSKSIYFMIIQYIPSIYEYIRAVFILCFLLFYIKMCFNILIEKNIVFYKIMKKYNFALILFMLILTNFQIWYLIWLFPTIIWQSKKTIKWIVQLGLIMEISNTAFMFFYESIRFDIIFVMVTMAFMILGIEERKVKT